MLNRYYSKSVLVCTATLVQHRVAWLYLARRDIVVHSAEDTVDTAPYDKVFDRYGERRTAVLSKVANSSTLWYHIVLSEELASHRNMKL